MARVKGEKAAYDASVQRFRKIAQPKDWNVFWRPHFTKAAFAVLEKDITGRAAFLRLVDDGYDSQELLANCEGLVRFHKLKRTSREERVISRVSDAAKEATHFATMLKSLRSEKLVEQRLTHNAATREALQKADSFLPELSEVLTRFFHDLQNRGNEELKAYEMAVFFLATSIEAVTGHEHHREILELLEAFGHREPGKNTPEAVRKKLDRYLLDNPGLRKMLADLAVPPPLSERERGEGADKTSRKLLGKCPHRRNHPA